ncbi:sugar phosphate nucleotidyltransferase [Alkalicoccobacillus gibsonii]|uniref:Glucose-1-phosphate thymidylyltransferase n=1 Tax=Alkalicoccobacillus gibsonii TaxID=79881 RepID=A0ABU9VNW8_9BACI
MKGVILAGGTGSRLLPLTATINKHMLPVGRYPMIMHGLARLKEAGILDVLVIVGKRDGAPILGLLGNGKRYGMNITYRVQESPGGIADALRLAKGFVGSEQVTVLLGDNLFTEPITNAVRHFQSEERYDAMVMLKKVDDPERFGVATIEDGVITSIDEKPLLTLSNDVVTGLYLYHSSVFDIIETLLPSSRGELEITDVNLAYLSNNKLGYQYVQGEWIDAGTHESLAQAHQVAAPIDLDPILSRTYEVVTI